MGSLLKIIGLALLVLISFPIAQGTNWLAAIAVVVFFVGSLVLYFCPTIVAASRRHQNKMSIIVVNLFLGWTLIGWVTALAWAYTASPSPAAREE